MVNEQKVMCSASSISMNGFSVESSSAMEVDEKYSLVKGEALRVYNPNGDLIHEGIRGFMLLDDTYHLIRMADGFWWYCTVDGKPKRKKPLSKKNINVGSLVLMVDERGKLRLGQNSVHFPMLVLR